MLGVENCWQALKTDKLLTTKRVMGESVGNYRY